MSNSNGSFFGNHDFMALNETKREKISAQIEIKR